MTKRQAIAEGLADHEIEAKDASTLADVAYWASQAFDPCCYTCGCYEYYKEELHTAVKARRTFLEQFG